MSAARVSQQIHEGLVKFNPNDPTELASNGKERVLFLNWEQGIS